MARPREFDEVTVLTALRDVFWQHGYEGTSYALIMEATGLKKGSLYAAFGDKMSLYMAAISQYDQEYICEGVKMLRDPTLKPELRIKQLFDGLVEAAGTPMGRWGCLLCNAATDLAPFDDKVAETVSKSMNSLKDAIKSCIQNTPAQGQAEIIWSSYFGGRVLLKSGTSTKNMTLLRDQALNLLAI